MAAFTNSFATDNPVGTSLANQLDAFIRTDTKAALDERFSLEHYSLETGVNDDEAQGGQGRHIPGKVGCLFYGTLAQIQALSNPGVGSIAYATDQNNFYFLNTGGWQILALTSDTILPDNVTLEVIGGNVLGMKHDNQQWTSIYTLTDGTTINTDCDNSNSFKVTLAGNRTLANPTNLKSGATYVWIITQDSNGSRTLTFGSTFRFPSGVAPVLTTTPNAVDMISGIFDGAKLRCTAAYNI
jgi:hypothetical protein